MIIRDLDTIRETSGAVTSAGGAVAQRRGNCDSQTARFAILTYPPSFNRHVLIKIVGLYVNE